MTSPADGRTVSPLSTDLYQLTMAYGYWLSEAREQEAIFHLQYRRNPFGGGYVVAAGLEAVARYLEGLRFSQEDLAYLARVSGADGRPLFSEEYLGFLSGLEFHCDVDMMPEGTVVFPHEPLARVRGPIIEAQLVESTLLNLVNFPSLVATKAARICEAARGDPVLEFGLRRAQGPNGALTASRAAYLGGCVATSNVLAGKCFGIPVRGTHAHSWVMAFPSEREAFEAYARALPNNAVFLVDTYDTLEGVANAVEVGRWLRAQGHELGGVRLDSGDLAYLSVEARKILDAAGFPEAMILASNELDEHVIASLKEQGAAINAWGVGTRLATAWEEPALGGVYKLAAVRSPGQEWQWRVKLSEQAIKVTTPGILQVRRFSADGEFIGDMIYDEELGMPQDPLMVDPMDMTRRRSFPGNATHEELLVPLLRGGGRVLEIPPLEDSRARARDQLSRFHPGIRRFVHPHRYPVGLEKRLHERRTELILAARAVRR